MKPYHPGITGFDNAVKSLCMRICDVVKYVISMVLPIAVEEHIKHGVSVDWNRYDACELLRFEVTKSNMSTLMTLVHFRLSNNSSQ